MGRKMKSKGVLVLTSSKINGELNSSNDQADFVKFIYENKLSAKQSDLISTIFNEANQNNFRIKIKGVL